MFCVDSQIQRRIVEKVCLLEVERGSMLEVENGYALDMKFKECEFR